MPTFMDRVGDAFGKVGGAIGSAWSAGADTAAGEAIGAVVGSDSWFSNNLFEPAVADPTKHLVGSAASALNFAYSYGISRPLSTALMWQDYNKTFDPQYWRQNWNRSEDISLGQAAAVNVNQIFGFGPEWTEGGENDPFADQYKADREQYFYHTNQGQLMSGAFDLIGNIYGDPFAVAGAGSKILRAGNEGLSGMSDLDRGVAALNQVRDTEAPVYPQKTPEAAQAVQDALDPKNPKMSSKLDELIKSSPLDDNAQLYAYDFPVANLKVGDEVEAGQYIRTRTEPATPEVFRQQGSEDLPTMFRINAEPGAPVLRANDYLSDDPNVLVSEDAILGKGTKFKIVKDAEEEVLDPTGQPMLARVIEADLIDSPYKPEYGKDRWGRQISRIFLDTDNKSAAEIAVMPEFRNLPDAGAIGYFMSRANQVFPGQTDYNSIRRHQLKSDILGVAMGDKSAIDRIKETNAHLAEEYAKMGDSIPAADLSVGIRWDKDNQGTMLLFGERAGQLDQRRAKQLEQQQVMYDRLLSNAGPDRARRMASPGLQAGLERAPDVLKAKMDAYKLKEIKEPRGLGGTALRWVIGNAQTRVPGSVNIRESERGREDMLNTFSQVRAMSSKQKKQLVDNYVKAKTDSERISAVKTAEVEIFRAYAKKHGVSPQLATEVMKRIQGHRDTWQGYLKNRAYSAINQDVVDLYDPMDDVRHVFSKPLALSQIENHAQLLDPRLLDKTFKQVSKSRLLERLARQGSVESAERMGKALDKADAGREIMDQILGTYTRAWKDAMLFRLAYPLRNQVDNQARLVARIGMLQTMMSMTTSVNGVRKYLLESPDSDRSSLRNIFKGDQSTIANASKGHLMTKDSKVRQAALAVQATTAGQAASRWTGYKVRSNVSEGGLPISPVMDEAELYAAIGNFQSTGGGQADLGKDIENRLLGSMRGTGDWSIIDTDDPQWWDSWQRAVRQIGASPTLSKAATTSNTDALAEFVRTNPAAKREWVELSEHYEDVYEWLDDVVAHVDLYLPTDELKGIVAKNQEILGDGDVARNVGKMLRDTGARDKQGLDTDKYTDKYAKLTPKAEQFKAERDAAIAEHKAALKNAKAVKAQFKIPRAKQFYSTPANGRKRRTTEQVKADNAAYREAVAKRKSAVTAANQRLKEARKLKGKKAAKYNNVAAAMQNTKRNIRTSEQLERNIATVQMQSEMPMDWRSGSFREAEEYFRNVDNRMPVHGENFAPNKVNPVSQFAAKVRKNWYQLASDMPETVMGRSPLYRRAFQEYMREAIDNLGPEGIDSTMLERIRRGADLSARKEIGKVLYDSTNASNFADTIKYLSPFFSAWQDSMTKWAGLIYSDPKVGSYLSQAWMAPETSGLVVDENGNRIDEDGNFYDQDGKLVTDRKFKGRSEYIVLPEWAGGALIPGDNGQFRINKKNLNILFQGDPPWLPGVGPLVQVPTNEISKRAFPENVSSNPILKYVLPYGNTNDSLLTQAGMPAWVKQARNAFGNSQEHANTYVMLQAQEWDKYSRGERKSKPTAEEISKMTRNWFILRAATGNASPVSITPTPGNQLYIDKAREYQRKYRDTDVDWKEKFYEDFPGYFYSSMRLSENNTGIEATLEGFDRTKKYRKQINANPEYGWMFVGADNLGGTFDPNIYNWQESAKTNNGETFRGRQSPQEALDKANEEMGWIEYSKMAEAIDLELKARGLRNIQQTGAEDLAEMKREYTQYLSTENLAWGKAFNTRDDSKLLTFVATAREAMASDPELAKRDDMQALNSYLDARTQMMGILATRETKDITDDRNADLKQMWDGYLAYLRDESIGFGQMYDRVLEHSDDLTRSL